MHSEEWIRKSIRNRYFENCMGVGSCMDFGVSTYALCTILKNELGKILETGFKKIVIMADMDFGACD